MTSMMSDSRTMSTEVMTFAPETNKQQVFPNNQFQEVQETMSSDASSSVPDTDLVEQEKFLQACEEENIEAMVELIESSE